MARSYQGAVDKIKVTEISNSEINEAYAKYTLFQVGM
jgi:hypothetical protein